MKILAWNVGHKASERKLKPKLVEAIAKMDADVVVLNEYVHGDSRKPLELALQQSGLHYILVSENVPDKENRLNNQVLIASRFELTQGDLQGPRSFDGGGESNFLHVRLPHDALEIVGIRVPAWKEASLRHGYWTQMQDIIRRAADRRIVFIGDINATPGKKGSVGSGYLAALGKEGWVMPEPEGSWSFSSGKRFSRIDHAIISRHLRATEARYLSRLDDLELVASEATSSISDHLPLLVSIGDSLLSPSAVDFDAMLRFLPIFAAPDFKPVEESVPPQGSSDGFLYLSEPAYTVPVQQFYEVTSQPQWLHPDYDPSDAAALLRDTERLANATLDELRRCLTFCLRGERFCEGHRGEMIRNGNVIRLLRRLQQLRLS